MRKISFLKKKIDGAYLVWFKGSDNYMQLEEPAWFVLSKLSKRYSIDTVANLCVLRYNQDFGICLKFVKDVLSKVEEVSRESMVSAQNKHVPDQAQAKSFVPYANRKYQLSDKVVGFCYETQELESLIHPLIGYLEIGKTEIVHSTIELYEFEGNSVLRANGSVKGIFSGDRIHRLIGFTYMSMINEMYGKDDDFWLMTVHAAAVTNGKKAILIPAGSGSGKTTLAAMLQRNGYRLLSDDFIPIDKEEFRAWHFPIAMSVKSGSLDVLSDIYPNLAQEPLKHTNSNKTVRYLYPDYDPMKDSKGFPIREVVSVKYDPKIDFSLRKADTMTLVKLLLDQSWILPKDGNAEIFLNRVSKLKFYELTYSDNKKALEGIAKIFRDAQ